MRLERIDRPNVYGYHASNGSVDVEILRHYQGEWHVWILIPGDHPHTANKQPVSYTRAVSIAHEVLFRQEIHGTQNLKDVMLCV